MVEGALVAVGEARDRGEETQDIVDWLIAGISAALASVVGAMVLNEELTCSGDDAVDMILKSAGRRAKNSLPGIAPVDTSAVTISYNAQRPGRG